MTVADFIPFRRDLNAVADSLEVLRKRVCCYLGSTCDCKYGLSEDVRPGSEATGCPELRDAIRLLRSADTQTIEGLLSEKRHLLGLLTTIENQIAGAKAAM